MFTTRISSTNQRHAFVQVFQNGGLAGALCVETNAVPVLEAALHEPDATMCPVDIRQSIQDYLAHGLIPGSFVLNLLMNNLMGAYACADATNRYYVPHIVAWMYQHIPAHAWGSAERVDQWLASIAKQKEDVQ